MKRIYKYPKLEVAGSPDFIKKINTSLEELKGKCAKDTYVMKKADVGRALFEVFAESAHLIDAENVCDQESLIDEVLAAIKQQYKSSNKSGKKKKGK